MASMVTPSPLPGQSPPFETYTDTNHTAWIVVITAIGIALMLMFSAIKVFVRWGRASVGLDEYFLAIAALFAIVQASVVLGACSIGLGKSIDLIPHALQDRVQQMYYASNLLYITALMFSKLSVAYLLLRLTPDRKAKISLYMIMGAIVTWGLGAFITMAVKCGGPCPWKYSHCHGLFVRWELIAIFDVITEGLMFLVPLHLVWKLTTKDVKVTVLCIFGLRLSLIIPTVFRWTNLNRNNFATNPTLLESAFYIWTEIEITYSIVSAIIPSLKPFIKDLATNYGMQQRNKFQPKGALVTTIGSAGLGLSPKDAQYLPKNEAKYDARIWAQDEATRSSRRNSKKSNRSNTTTTTSGRRKSSFWNSTDTSSSGRRKSDWNSTATPSSSRRESQALPSSSRRESQILPNSSRRESQVLPPFGIQRDFEVDVESQTRRGTLEEITLEEA